MPGASSGGPCALDRAPPTGAARRETDGTNLHTSAVHATQAWCMTPPPHRTPPPPTMGAPETPPRLAGRTRTQPAAKRTEPAAPRTRPRAARGRAVTVTRAREFVVGTLHVTEKLTRPCRGRGCGGGSRRARRAWRRIRWAPSPCASVMRSRAPCARARARQQRPARRSGRPPRLARSLTRAVGRRATPPSPSRPAAPPVLRAARGGRGAKRGRKAFPLRRR